MVLLDSIIKTLQSNGGVTVYFDNIEKGLKEHSIDFLDCFSFLNDNQSRLLERYRKCQVGRLNGVFHSSYYRLPSNNRVKVVTTVHDFIYEKFSNGPVKWVHCWQKYRAIKNSDIVICVSHNTSKDLLHYCPIDPSKIRVIHNGVSEVYQPVANVDSTNEVLFVGARSGYKNFAMAVNTLAQLPELTLSIVGGGELNKSERGLLDELIPNRYKWLGRLSDEELNKAYNRAYALLYPSSYEGFGIPIIEAMRAGCPVVAVDSSSIPEVAGNAAILTASANSDLFTEALQLAGKQREKLRLMGFEQAKKFSWDTCFQETLKVYKELM